MHTESSRPCPNLTSRLSKISSTLKVLNPAVQALTSRDQPMSTHHSHRKYKLSHSQIDKIDKLSLSGLTKMKIKKEDFTGKLLQTNRFAQNDDKPTSSQCLTESIVIKEIHHKANYQITKDKVIQLSPQSSLRVEIIDFQIPLPNNTTRPVSVICFEVHNSETDTHFRSEFTYETLGLEFRLMFDDVMEIFEYITSKESIKRLKFCLQSFDLEIIVEFQKGFQTKIKALKLHLLPFAVIQILQNHDNQSQKHSEDLETKQNLEDLHKDLQVQTNLVNALRTENDQLKIKLKSKKNELQTLKKDNNLLSENFQQMSKASEINKQYFFEFVPDSRANNFSNFSIKNKILQKQKNDLKWDQISSEAPLPHSQRHYFTVLLKSQTPDCMLGIVTLKGKDTLNAFLGTEVACLYIKKENLFVYQKGQHYKISRSVEEGDMILVMVDIERGLLEWMKKPREKLGNHLANITNSHQSSQKTRKLSQNIQCADTPPVQAPILQECRSELEFIHSIKIPEQMLFHELYAYLEVYNINEPLKLNDRK